MKSLKKWLKKDEKWFRAEIDKIKSSHKPMHVRVIEAQRDFAKINEINTKID